jgi:hypothetical protein
MKDEGLSMYTVSKQFCICWDTLKDYTQNFWSIITAYIVKLLVMPPYMVKSFVGLGLMTNQIRYVAIKITEALRLSIVKLSQLIGIGGLY